MTPPDTLRVRRAVIPAAGRGTRMRTLAGPGPKELLSVGGAPMLLYAVADCVRSGIRDIAIVTAPDKPDIERALTSPQPDDPAPLAAWRACLAACTLHFVVQAEPLGLAHAVACAGPVLGSDPFVMFLPDNVFAGDAPVTAQLLETFAAVQHPTVGMVPVAQDAAAGYGNCGAIEFDALDEQSVRITHLGDKGTGGFNDATDSGWRTCGVSVLTREFLDINAKLEANVKGEWDDVPILQRLARAGRLYGRRLPNRCYDAGNLTGFAAANEAGVTLPAPPGPCHV